MVIDDNGGGGQMCTYKEKKELLRHISLCLILSFESIVYLYMTLHGMNEPMDAITELHMELEGEKR